MKATSNPKNSSLPRESTNPASTRTSAALKTGSSTQKSARPAGPDRAARQTATRPPTIRPTGPNNGTSGDTRAAEKAPKTRASSVPSSAEFAKSDRVTMLAFYALFGAMLVGVIYFLALAFTL